MTTVAASTPMSARPEARTVDSLSGSENRRARTTRREVALTFNAAWDDAGVDTALKVLRERHVPAMFFLTGQFAEQQPAAARAMAAEHGIGNHSYDHPYFDDLSPARVAQQVFRADHAIREATGKEPLPFFRFPYSATTPRGIADVNALGFADVEFTVDTQGYKGDAGGMTVQRVVDRVVAALTPGAIVQMHVGADVAEGQHTSLDAEALPRIIDAIQAHGYRVVGLGALLLGPARCAPRRTC
ncbi:polysaccharide deacetylase family protein [Streptomyces sp. NPDC051162]|uniref:polysaccharide deacetylase family protein n=1 Tax=Streptomyces sp. NPDC051162 TaxID=3154747 RepID=UPI00341E7BE7